MGLVHSVARVARKDWVTLISTGVPMQPEHVTPNHPEPPTPTEPAHYSVVPQPAMPPPPEIGPAAAHGLATADGLAPVLDDALPGGLALSSVGKKLVANILESVLALFTLVIGWLIWAAMIAGKGQTPARQLLGMRIVSTRDGRPLSFPQMLFMRGLIGAFVQVIAVSLTFGVMILMPLWDRRNQTVTDKVSGSIVLDDPNKVLG